VVRGRVAALFLVAVGLAAPSARAGCHAEVEVMPEAPFVGQAVEYRVHILLPEDVDRVEWSRSPAFAHVRTERLPGSPKSLRVERHGERHRVSEERRMLFVERAGEIPLVAPELLCRREAGTSLTEVPSVVLRARDLPAAHPPADDAGVVGRVELQLTVTPERLALGETLRVALRVRGAGNVWDVRNPFASVDWGGAEVFERRPEVAIDRGRALMTRHHFVADVVPRSQGRWQLPELRVPYFDPDAEAYQVATTAPVTVMVGERRAPVPPKPAAPVAPRSASDAAAAPALLRVLAIGLALALVGWLAWRIRGRRTVSAGNALASLAEAGATADAERLTRILRSGLADALPGVASATPQEIAALPDLPPAVGEAAALLEALERARFDPSAPAPDAAAVRRALERL
jgi:hypothetical protein